MARLKELMILHMNSTGDAFKLVTYFLTLQFDQSSAQKLCYEDFSKLAVELHRLAGEAQPTYAIIKDLFDTIDIRKDGVIDLNEWEQTFGGITEGSKSLTIRATPLSTWENSREAKAIGSLIARNRKLLKTNLDQRGQGNMLDFASAKALMQNLLQQNYPGLDDEKLKVILRPSQAGPEGSYDFDQFLNILRKRHAA